MACSRRLQERFSGTLPGGGPSVFTVVVGRKPSAANYFLNDPDEVLELCQSLRLHSTRANRNRSMGDLQSMHGGGSRQRGGLASSVWVGSGGSHGAAGRGGGGGGGARRGVGCRARRNRPRGA